MIKRALTRFAVQLNGAGWRDLVCGVPFRSTPHHVVAASFIPVQMAPFGTALCSGKVEFWQTKLHGSRSGLRLELGREGGAQAFGSFARWVVGPHRGDIYLVQSSAMQWPPCE